MIDIFRYCQIICVSFSARLKQFKKMPKSIVSTGGFNYDLNSLMHYGPYSFPIIEDQPTIMPKPCVDMGMYDIDRNDATPNDIAEINALYNCDSKCKVYDFLMCMLNRSRAFILL